MDACGVERAVCVALSRGHAARRCCSPPSTPSASPGMVFIGPMFPVSRLRSLRWRVLAHPRLRPLRGPSRR